VVENYFKFIAFSSDAALSSPMSRNLLSRLGLFRLVIIASVLFVFVLFVRVHPLLPR
jgi:hypothetical protein